MRIVLIGVWCLALIVALRLAFVFIEGSVPMNVAEYLLGTYSPALVFLAARFFTRGRRSLTIVVFILVLLSIPVGIACVFAALHPQHASAGLGVVLIPLIVVVIATFVALAVSASIDSDRGRHPPARS
jgi:hypothetical protein